MEEDFWELMKHGKKKKSFLQPDDLNLKRIPKGTTVICDKCGQPTQTGVEILLAENEALLCGPCVDDPL